MRVIGAVLCLGMLCCLLFASPVVVGCGSGGFGDAVGPGGGSVDGDGGKFTVTIPAGVLQVSTIVSVKKTYFGQVPESLRPFYDMELGYSLTPDGLAFSVPATGELKLDEDEAEDYLVGSSLIGNVLLTDENGEMVYLDESFTRVDQENGDYLVRGLIDHFSVVVPSKGLVTFKVTPDGVQGEVGGEDITATVDLTGNDARIKDATLMTDIPSFVSIDPTSVHIDSPDDGEQTVTQDFTVTCNETGTDSIALYLDKPQTYFLSTANGTSEYTNDAKFGVIIPLSCTDSM
jgi:hypothetical protein